jgi:outer membrane protein assembly factor BamB
MIVFRRGITGLALLSMIGVGVARGGDWPGLLGPGRDGVAKGEKIAAAWPETGPRVVWKKKIGSGWAGPAVVGENLVVFYREEDRDVVECLDPATGAKRWRFDYASDYNDDFGFDNGPRATPTIDGDRVYTFGAAGVLHCLGLADGKEAWVCDTAAEMKGTKGYFGRVCSPLIEGKLVIVNVGGPGAGVVAFDKASGAVAWKATDDEAGYSSPIAATLAGQRRIVDLTRTGLVVLDPADGKVVYQKRWRAKQDASVNAATPLVVGDVVMLSASYGTGATALDFSRGGEPTALWAGDDILSSHYATPVCRDGLVFGFHGRIDFAPGPVVRCVELSTGKVRWSGEPIGGGTMLLVGDRLLILTDKGELILADASGEAMKVVAKAQVLGFDGRATAALAAGRLYARDKRQLICVDLRETK